MTSTLDRLDAARQKISKLQSDLNSSNRLTQIVGGVMLLVLAGYFAYGYREIQHLLEPDTLVPYGAQMLQDRIPEARHAIVKQVSDSAPAWAEQISVKLRGELPHLRTQLEAYVLEQTDVMLKQVATLSEERMRTVIRENKDVLDTHIRELADHEELSAASAQALVTALESALQKDLKDQSELVLDAVRSLDSRVRDLAKGEGLDEEEQIERRVLMLARRIQLSEADPQPISAPEVKPFVKAASGESPAALETKAAEVPATEAPAVDTEPAQEPASSPTDAPVAPTAPGVESVSPATP